MSPLFASQDKHVADWTSLRIEVDGIDGLYARSGSWLRASEWAFGPAAVGYARILDYRSERGVYCIRGAGRIASLNKIPPRGREWRMGSRNQAARAAK